MRKTKLKFISFGYIIDIICCGIKMSRILFLKIRYLLLVMLASIFQCEAQVHKYSKEETDRMTEAYAFYLVQLNSVQAVSLRFPKLADLAQDALNTWNKRFMASVELIDQELTADRVQEWQSNKSQMIKKYSGGDYSRVSEEAAKQYIFEVNQRAIGKIQSPVLETFLIFNPEYQKNPIKEYTDGYIEVFNSKKSKKQLGLDIMLKVPKSWKLLNSSAKNDNKLHFVTGYGMGNVSLDISINRQNSTSDSKKVLSKENLMQGLIKKEEVLSFNADYTVDNCPAAKITYYHEEKNQIRTQGTLHVVYALNYTNYLIKIAFNYTSPSGREEDVLNEYEKYKELEIKIKNSFVILSHWDQKK
jgi:hypothetical protein